MRHKALSAVLAKQGVDVFIDELATSVLSELLELESGERLDLEEPAADGVECVALAFESEAPELARVVVTEDEEVPGASEAQDADTWEVSVAAEEASRGALRGRREGKVVCLPNLAWIANTNPATQDTQAVNLAATCKLLNGTGV